MSQLDNISNIKFSTAFNTDKIVGVYRDSYQPGVGTTLIGGFLYQHAIPHSFTRPVFAELLWSTDGVNYFDGGAGSSGAQSAIAYSDSSNMYILTPSNTGTLYYKIIATWIDDYDGTNPAIEPVLNTTATAYFDSRLNIPKVITSSTTTISGTGTQDIVHGLGYAPNFKGFFESISGQVWPLISGGNSDAWLYDFSNQMECAALIDSTKIQLQHTGPASTRTVWYRVYGDS